MTKYPGYSETPALCADILKQLPGNISMKESRSKVIMEICQSIIYCKTCMRCIKENIWVLNFFLFLLAKWQKTQSKDTTSTSALRYGVHETSQISALHQVVDFRSSGDSLYQVVNVSSVHSSCQV